MATLAQARTDPNFRVTAAPISMQAFGNTVAAPPPEAERPDLDELGRSMAELPVSASPVSSTDGYKPEAMLFVDEEFAGVEPRRARGARGHARRGSRSSAFKTRHYRYVRGAAGPHLVQVGDRRRRPDGHRAGFCGAGSGGGRPAVGVSSLRPLCADWHEAGVEDALRRHAPAARVAVGALGAV